MIKITTSNALLNKQIQKAIDKKITKMFKMSEQPIKKRVQALLFRWISTSDAWRGMNGLYTNLQGELGIPENGIDGRFNEILKAWLRTVEVKTIKGPSLQIVAITDDYSEVLSLSEASYETDRGQIIEFLKWMLIEGDSVKVANFSFFPRPGAGRSEEGFLKINRGAFWEIPAPFNKPESGNFINEIVNSATFQRELRQEILDGLLR